MSLGDAHSWRSNDDAAPNQCDPWRGLWLHVDTDATTTLATLDEFLRTLWLECCDHMSAFTIDETQFVRPYSDEQAAGRYDQRSMDVPLAAVVHGGQEFTYEYDFGTTTELSLRVTELGPYEPVHDPIDDDLGFDILHTTDVVGFPRTRR